MQESMKNHRLTIENKKNISVTEVDAVLSFNETKITLSLLGGARLSVTGNGLKIVGFSKTEGTFFGAGRGDGHCLRRQVGAAKTL